LRQRDGILNIKAAYNLVALRIDPVRIHVAPYCKFNQKDNNIRYIAHIYNIII